MSYELRSCSRRNLVAFFKDLAKNPGYKVIVTNGTAHAEYFSSADADTSPAQASIWRRMLEDPRSTSSSNEEIEKMLLLDKAGTSTSWCNLVY